MSWGKNVFGQLGDGTTVDAHSPVTTLLAETRYPIAGIPSPREDISVSILSLDDGDYIWRVKALDEYNLEESANWTTAAIGFTQEAYSAPGIPNIELIDDGSTVTTPTLVFDIDDDNPEEIILYELEVTDADDTNFLNVVRTLEEVGGVLPDTVALGYNHALAIKSDGTVVAWGSNSNGQLGIGENAGADDCNATDCNLAAVAVPGLSDIVKVVAGSDHNLAMDSSGNVYAWGDNANNQMGDDTGNNWYTPSQLSSTGVFNIDAKGDATFIMYNDASVDWWGEGESLITVTGFPNPVSNVLGFDQGAGLEYIAVDSVTGDLWYNSPLLEPESNPMSLITGAVDFSFTGLGALILLDDGTIANFAGPGEYTLMEGIDSVEQLATGSNFMLALKSDGTVWGFGDNSFGQLGVGEDNAPDDCEGDNCSDSFIQIPSLSNIEYLYANSSDGMVVSSDAIIYAWGLNGYGMIGDGTYDNIRFTPVTASFSDLYISEAGDHSPRVDITVDVPDLDGGDYIWRVRGVDETELEGEWAYAYNGFTVRSPNVPTIDTLNDGLNIPSDSDIIFQFDMTDDVPGSILRYELQKY